MTNTSPTSTPLQILIDEVMVIEANRIADLEKLADEHDTNNITLDARYRLVTSLLTKNRLYGMAEYLVDDAAMRARMLADEAKRYAAAIRVLESGVNNLLTDAYNDYVQGYMAEENRS